MVNYIKGCLKSDCPHGLKNRQFSKFCVILWEFCGAGRGINSRKRAIINVMIFEKYFMQTTLGSKTRIMYL
jgi:hypothetical protein